MLVGAEGFIDQTHLFGVALFKGRFGSGKTLLAVATAQELLRRGVVKQVMANIPVSFAVSPPPLEGKPFDFHADYARGTCYIIDEAWAGFMEFSPDRLRATFAFVRKWNQVFLLTSVLPLQDARRYCFLFCERYYNWGVWGLPLLWYKFYLSAGKGVLYGDRPQSFYVWLPGMHFGDFDTYARPMSIFPIDQGVRDESEEGL